MMQPMLLSSATTVPVGPGWSFELKWDGYRAIATIRGDRLELRSRNGTLMTRWFEPLADLPRHIGSDAVLDGEVVALDAEGRPNFYALRRPRPTFIAFDVLQVAGRNVCGLPLRDRRAILAELVVDDLPLVLRSRPFADGLRLLAQAERRSLEGIVCKRDDQPYLPGKRVAHWVKVKTAAGKAEGLRRLEASLAS
jgi:bifunctional non-homologous end joining protein LigD